MLKSLPPGGKWEATWSLEVLAGRDAVSHVLGEIATLQRDQWPTITIEVKGDNKKEVSETLYLDLFGNSSNSLFTKNRGIGTILSDD